VNLDWIGALLLALAPIEVYVAYRYVRAASKRPYIDFLTASAAREMMSALGGVFLALIGVNVLHRALFGELLFVPGLSIVLLLAAMLLFSAGAIVKLAYIRRWDAEDRRGR